MLKNALSIVFVCALAAGCGGGSAGSAGAGDNVGEFGAADLGYEPVSRWPGQGQYSYDFDYTYNGARCVAKQDFNSEAKYCLGLQDQTLNQSCALSLRKDSYESECGKDFQEINFQKSFWLSGYDSRLQKSCETGRPASFTFRTAKKFCQFLKDESLHKGCMWDKRFQEFQTFGCGDGFSTAPVAKSPEEGSTPPQPPQPPQPPPPTTPADPLDHIAVVRNLRAQGIEVEVNWSALRDSDRHRFPGEPTVEARLQTMWQEIAKNERAFIARKDSISKIQVTIYTNYRRFGDVKQSSIDFETGPGDLEQYFPLFDKQLKYSRELGMNFSFIHSGYATDAAPYRPLREVLDVIESRWADVQAIKGTVAELHIDSYAAYFSTSKTLTLSRSKTPEDFKRYLQLLKPLGPFYSWAEKNDVSIESDFNLEQDSDKIRPAFEFLQNNLDSLSLAVRAGLLKKLKLYFTDGDSNHFSSSQTLILAVGPNSRAFLGACLKNFGKMAKMSLDLGAPISNRNSELKEDFNRAVSLAEMVWPKVMAKANKIKSVTFFYTSSYYPSSQSLTIGASSSLKETEDVIAKIR